MVGDSQALFDVPAALASTGSQDWIGASPDRTRLLLKRPVVVESRTLGVALSWFETVRRLTDGRRRD